MPEDPIQTCQECGASVYPEHLKIHSAGTWQGRLLCPHCLAEKKMLAEHPPSAESLAIAAEVEEDSAPIALLPPERSDTAARAPSSGRIKAFGGGAALGAAADSVQTFRRGVLNGSSSATRCRTFHSKLNDASLSHMDRTINEWIDSHDEVEVKFAVSSIGVFEGKHAEPNLIVTIFY